MKDEIEKQEAARQQKDENGYWVKRFQDNPSEPWHKLIEAERIVYNRLKPGCERCREAHGIRREDCYPLMKPGVSFLIATDMNKEPVGEILQQQRDDAITSGRPTQFL